MADSASYSVIYMCKDFLAEDSRDGSYKQEQRIAHTNCIAVSLVSSYTCRSQCISVLGIKVDYKLQYYGIVTEFVFTGKECCNMHIVVFTVEEYGHVAPYSLVEVCHCCKGTYCLPMQNNRFL
jgi:hypothetical protein